MTAFSCVDLFIGSIWHKRSNGKQKGNPVKKKLLIGCGGGFFACVLISIIIGLTKGTPSNTDTTYTEPSTKRPSATRTPIPTPIPTPTPTLRELLDFALIDSKPDHDCSLTWEYNAASGNLGASIDTTYFFEDILTEKLILKDCVRSFLKTAPELYRVDPSLDVLNLDFETTFVDKYGQESQGALLKIQILRETADKINWDNMLVCNIPEVVEAFKPHPSLIATWGEVCP